MEFKAKFGGFFLLQILLIVGCLVVASLDLFAPVFKNGFLHYNYVIYYLLALTWSFKIYRQFYGLFIDKPILIINESYLYDFNHDITYYWKDIDNVYRKRNFLIINLKQPAEYLDRTPGSSLHTAAASRHSPVAPAESDCP